MDMVRSELAELLSDIREKTGADVSLVPRGGEETVFPFEWKGGRAELYVAGTGESAEREAKLVSYLLSGAFRKEAAQDRPSSLREVLLGEGGSWRAHRFLTRYNLTDRPCFAVELSPDKREAEAFEHVERCLDGDDTAVLMGGGRIAVVKFLEEGQTPYEFGVFLSQSLYEETGIHASVGVGCEAKSFGDISVSYHQAVAAVRMSALFHGEGEVHSYREYLLVRMLEEVPKAKLKEYIEQFRIDGAEEVLSDEDMAGTAEAFLESSLNASETSRTLFMHRNTLAYRLDKIERTTGLNIRKFSDAVTFRVITILYKLLQS